MKKIIVCFLSALYLMGCSSTLSSDDTRQMIKILSPTGAPALSLLSMSDDAELTFVDGTDVLQTAFVSVESEYDLIVAPTNLGVKLISSGKSDYRLAAVVTWGNLYVLAENETVLNEEDCTFAAFGQQAVPGLVFEQIKDELGVEEITYYNSVSEVQAALLSNHADAALIAEPAATATIAKAKERGLNISILYDVQSLWEKKTGSKGYPQASIFVKETSENKAQIDEILNSIHQSIDNQKNLAEKNPDELKEMIDFVGAETLGIPNSTIVSTCFARLGLDYRDATVCEKELIDFLSLFNIEYNPETVLR